MTQDAPVRKTDNGAYLSFFAQDDFRVHPRVTLNLGLRYDLQFPFTDPQDRKLAFVPGQKSQVSPNAPVGLLFPGDPGIPRGIAQTDKNNIAPRLGINWDPKGDGRMSVRAAAGIFYGSTTGNEWNTTADNQPFTVRQSFPTVFTLVRSLPQPARRRRPVPVQLRPGQSALHAAGHGLRDGPRLRLAVHVPDEPHRREGAPPQLQHERVLRRGAGTQAARQRRRELPRLRAGSDRGQRQRSTPVHAGHHRRRSCPPIHFQERLPRPPAQRRAAGHPLLGQGLLFLRQGPRGRRLPGGRASGGPELEPARAGACPHVRRPHAQLRALRHLEDRLLQGVQGPGPGAPQRLDDLDHRHPAEWHSAHDQLRPGPQPRRPHQRSRRHHRRPEARQRPSP